MGSLPQGIHPSIPHQVFNIHVEPTLRSVKREFEFAANLFQGTPIPQSTGEFLKSTDPLQEIIRFDFYRYVFLERNL